MPTANSAIATPRRTTSPVSPVPTDAPSATVLPLMCAVNRCASARYPTASTAPATHASRTANRLVPGRPVGGESSRGAARTRRRQVVVLGERGQAIVARPGARHLEHLGQVERPTMGGLCDLLAAAEATRDNQLVLRRRAHRREQHPLATAHRHVIVDSRLETEPAGHPTTAR